MAYFAKSPWVIHYDASSCNGCDIEVLAALCPGFDAERFGVINTGNPKHADIFLVTGSVNEQNISVVKEIYEQMLEPKVVVACGICACSGGRPTYSSKLTLRTSRKEMSSFFCHSMSCRYNPTGVPPVARPSTQSFLSNTWAETMLAALRLMS